MSAPPPAGLSSAEAAARLARDGPNALPTQEAQGTFAIVREVAREPMFLLLIAGAVVSAVVGETGEAAMLSLAVLGVVTITVVQERRTAHALARLRDLAAPRAVVVRDGQPRRVAATDVVVGDLVLLGEGDRVPADVDVVEARGLVVDESLLTGESVPVGKLPVDRAEPGPVEPGGDLRPHAWSGTLVVGGRGSALVRAVGASTAMGRIGTELATLAEPPGPLRVEFDRVARVFGMVAIVLTAALFALLLITTGDWGEAVLRGIAFGMAMVPEEIPVVLTVFLALGAWRIAQSRVLTRRFPAIETLGAATVLCVDKTGTLTLNRMSVARLWRDGHMVEADAPLDDGFASLLATAAAACPPHAVDPMDRATRELGERRGLLAPDAALAHEIPLSADHPWILLAWRRSGVDALEVAAKGAPEHLARAAGLDASARAALLAAVEAMAKDGLRVLAVGSARVSPDAWRDDAPPTLVLEGLVGFEDPVRPEVPDAVARARRAGLRVVVITGDAPATAAAVARPVGLDGEVALGPEVLALDDEALGVVARRTTVFARAVPELKLRLVRVLQAQGEVVAMTGDGVNDAPALRAAHIGIAMGQRGTDVAREAASLVLLDDDFASITRAVALGRRIHTNLRKAMRFVLAVHVPIVVASLIPPLFGLPPLLRPMHVALLELIIDPACSVSFEAEDAETGAMERPPRAPGERVFDRAFVVSALLQGAGVALAVLATWWAALEAGATEPVARAVGFTTLIVGDLALIAADRAGDTTGVEALRRPHRAFVAVVGASLLMLAVLLGVPAVSELFALERPGASWLGLAALAGVLSVAPAELVKLVRRARAHEDPGVRSLGG